MMKPRFSIKSAALAAVALVGISTAAYAAVTDEVKAINDAWAHITYEVQGSSTQTKALAALEKQAAGVVAHYPGQAEPLLWEGIVVSEEANRANIFHKLGLATRARDLIGKAYAINPRAANGGAALSLGVLYYKVPGSPIGFGDVKKAHQLLREALALDPNGLDTNYWYAEFLYDQGNIPGARSFAQKALRAPHDASRPVWDAGRRREVNALLKKMG